MPISLFPGGDIIIDLPLHMLLPLLSTCELMPRDSPYYKALTMSFVYRVSKTVLNKSFFISSLYQVFCYSNKNVINTENLNNYKFKKNEVFTYWVTALYQQLLCSWDKGKIDVLSLMDKESF